MSALRIWFNRNYATTMHALEQLRANPEGRSVFLLGTHADLDSPMLQACDAVAAEPDITEPGEYVDWALEFCGRHGVEVFVPRLHQQAVADRAADFAAAGVGLVCPPADAIRVLGDKDAAYRAAQVAGLAVPPWRIVADGQEFAAAVADLRASLPQAQLCFKPVDGVGGTGFRLLDDGPLHLDALLEAPAPVEATGRVVAALQAAQAAGQVVPRFMVMPYMQGPEVSVDVLARGGELLVAVPRSKDGRARVLLDDPACVEYARAVVARFGLSYLANVQLRWWQDAPALLEVNTRGAGGVYQSGLAGVNLTWAAVRLALTGEPGPAVSGRVDLGARYVTVQDVRVLTDRPRLDV